MFWPLVIYFTQRKALKPLLMTVIAAGPVLRMLGAWYMRRAGACQLVDPLAGLDGLTTTQLDAFAAGGFLALFPLGGSIRALLLSPLVWLGVGLALLVHSGLRWTSLATQSGWARAMYFLRLYVVHFPMQELVSKAVPHAPLAAQIAVQAALSVAVASCSFYLWEQPSCA